MDEDDLGPALDRAMDDAAGRRGARVAQGRHGR
jgi:hypothetical protein